MDLHSPSNITQLSMPTCPMSVVDWRCSLVYKTALAVPQGIPATLQAKQVSQMYTITAQDLRRDSAAPCRSMRAPHLQFMHRHAR